MKRVDILLYKFVYMRIILSGFFVILLQLVVSDGLQLPCHGSFATCLLQALEFTIPDSCTHEAFEDLCAKDLRCGQAHINDLKSSYLVPSKLDTKLVDVKLHCDGEYTYGQIKGHLKAEVSISSLSLDVTINNSSDNEEYPTILSPSNCVISTLDVNLSFNGGITGKILNLISPIIIAIIRDNIESTVCTKVSQLVSNDGSAFLVGQVDTVLKELIDRGNPDSPNPSPGTSLHEYILWDSSIIGQANRFIFNDYKGRLGHCLFGDATRSNVNTMDIPEDGIVDSTEGSIILSSQKNIKERRERDIGVPDAVPMDKIISYITGGTGKLTLYLGTKAVLPIPDSYGANTSILFNEITIAGLDSLTVVDVLHPSIKSEMLLSSSLYFGYLDLTLAFSVCSGLSGQQFCDKDNSTMNVQLSNVTLEAESLIGIVKSRLNKLHLSELTSMAYWLSTADFANITSLSLKADVHSIAVKGSSSRRRSTVPSFINAITTNQNMKESEGFSNQSSDLDSGISDLLNNAFVLVLSDYRDLVNTILYASIQGPVRNTLNYNIAEMLASHRKEYPTENIIDKSHKNNWYDKMDSEGVSRQGDDQLVDWALFEPLILFKKISDQISTSDINGLTKCLSKGDQDRSVNGESQVGVTVSGLDSVYDFSLLQPLSLDDAKSHDLNCAIGIGACSEEVCTPLTIHTSVPATLLKAQKVSQYPLGIRESAIRTDIVSNDSPADGSVSLENIHIQFETLVELTVGAYRSIQVGQLSKQGCMLAIFQKIAFESLNIEIGKGIIGLQTSEESNIPLKSIAKQLKYLHTTVDVTKSLKKLFKLIGSKTILNQINNFLTQYSKQSKQSCDSNEIVNGDGKDSNSNDGNSEIKLQNEKIVIWIISFIIILFFMFSGIFYYFYHKNRSQNKIKLLKGQEKLMKKSVLKNRLEFQRKTIYNIFKFVNKEESSLDTEMNNKEIINQDKMRNDYLYMQLGGNDDTDITNNADSDKYLASNSLYYPMYKNTNLSMYVRVLIPIAMVVNTLLFSYSNVCMDAVTVVINVSSGVYSSLPTPVFTFGLLGTVVSMWEAKVYVLSILVAFLSGLWPYIKLFYLTSCWILPIISSSLPSSTRSLSVSTRYLILRRVELLGKWGLLDFYVMVLMMCAFHLNLPLPVSQMIQTSLRSGSSGEVEDLLVEVLVQPNFGFFSFLLATMMGHVLSHLMLGCHRHIVEHSSEAMNIADDTSNSSTNITTSSTITSDDNNTLVKENTLDTNNSSTKAIKKYSIYDHLKEISILSTSHTQIMINSEFVVIRSMSSLANSNHEDNLTNNINASNDRNNIYTNDNTDYVNKNDSIDGHNNSNNNNDNTNDTSCLNKNQLQNHGALNCSPNIETEVKVAYEAIHSSSPKRINEFNKLKNINELNKSTKLKYKLSNLGKILTISLLLMSIVLIIVSTSLLSFNFEFKGLVGMLLDKQETNKSKISYSFVSVGSIMQKAAGMTSSSAGEQNDIGNPRGFGLTPQVIIMQFCYFSFGIGAPLLVLVMSLILWILPLDLHGMKTVLLCIETLSAWTAIDVFCLSIAAALLEIRQFASFMVGDNCSDIDSLVAYFMPVQPGQEMKCFDVVATVTSNFIWLVLSAVLLQLSISLSSHVGRLLIQAKIKQSGQEKTITNKNRNEVLSDLNNDDTSLVLPILQESYLRDCIPFPAPMEAHTSLCIPIPRLINYNNGDAYNNDDKNDSTIDNDSHNKKTNSTKNNSNGDIKINESGESKEGIDIADDIPITTYGWKHFQDKGLTRAKDDTKNEKLCIKNKDQYSKEENQAKVNDSSIYIYIDTLDKFLNIAINGMIRFGVLYTVNN